MTLLLFGDTPLPRRTMMPACDAIHCDGRGDCQESNARLTAKPRSVLSCGQQAAARLAQCAHLCASVNSQPYLPAIRPCVCWKGHLPLRDTSLQPCRVSWSPAQPMPSHESPKPPTFKPFHMRKEPTAASLSTTPAAVRAASRPWTPDSAPLGWCRSRAAPRRWRCYRLWWPTGTV
jgi:hypothetical protein